MLAVAAVKAANISLEIPKAADLGRVQERPKDDLLRSEADLVRGECLLLAGEA
jgi:hypothetical protein